MSPITFLKIGVNNPEYNHILSFRRQVYTLPPENIEVPNSMVVTHEDASYRIFLSLNSLAYFKCKQSRHIAANCPNQPTPKKLKPNVENIPINNNANDMDAPQVETLNITP